MRLPNQQIHQFTGGVWLVGLGVLLYTGAWWPGILFLLGTVVLVDGMLRGSGWNAVQGLWLAALGIWAFYEFNIALLLVGIGLAMMVFAVQTAARFAKPKAPRTQWYD